MDERLLKHVAQQPFDGTPRDPTMESTILDLVLERLDRIESVLHRFVEGRTVKESYSPIEVAQILGKKPYTVREWCRLRRINAIKRECGRGASEEWEISHEELERIKAHGLLPIPTKY
jgi:lysyl-tRNA synthetase class I